MKNLKSKLLASIAMLLVSTVMLTSASFAWFTISTAPEITGISTQVTANGNLEIALDDGSKSPPEASAVTDNVGDYGKNETWGNLVDLNDYFSTANVVLKPVDLDESNGTVKIPTWGLDGRIKELVAATATNVETAHLKGIVTYTDGAETPSTYAIRVDFWLRSNAAGTISLSAAKDRGTGESAGTGSTLTGEGWNENIKVAFQPGGTGQLVTAARAENGALTANVLTLGAEDVNQAKLVSMYLYMDGAEMTNADFLTAAAKALALNIQFQHSANLTAMEVNASNPAT